MNPADWFQLVTQGGATAVLLLAVWAFITGKISPRWIVDEKNARIASLEQMVKEMTDELRASIKAQRHASELVRPEQVDALMKYIGEDLKKKIRGE